IRRVERRRAGDGPLDRAATVRRIIVAPRARLGTASSRLAAAHSHKEGRSRVPPFQRHHDAGNAAGRHAPGTPDRDILPGGYRIGGVLGSNDRSAIIAVTEVFTNERPDSSGGAAR